MKKEIEKKIKNIKILVLDVDGILTNGKININHQGHEFKVFDVKDGYSIVLFHKAGFKTAIISARSAPAVVARANDLGIKKIYQDASPKTRAYTQLLKQMKVKDTEVCFMGDDLPDVCVLKKVGLAITVPSAPIEVKRNADYITKKHGGDGAVREVVEMILKGQRKWNSLLRDMDI